MFVQSISSKTRFDRYLWGDIDSEKAITARNILKMKNFAVDFFGVYNKHLWCRGALSLCGFILHRKKFDIDSSFIIPIYLESLSESI